MSVCFIISFSLHLLLWWSNCYQLFWISSWMSNTNTPSTKIITECIGNLYIYWHNPSIRLQCFIILCFTICRAPWENKWNEQKVCFRFSYFWVHADDANLPLIELNWISLTISLCWANNYKSDIISIHLLSVLFRISLIELFYIQIAFNWDCQRMFSDILHCLIWWEAKFAEQMMSNCKFEQRIKKISQIFWRIHNFVFVYLHLLSVRWYSFALFVGYR